MTSVWYVGPADVRTITSAEWTAAGFTGAPATSEWSTGNGWSIASSAFSSDQLTLLGELGDFRVNAPDGPRQGNYTPPSEGGVSRVEFEALQADVAALEAGAGDPDQVWTLVSCEVGLSDTGDVAAITRVAPPANAAAALVTLPQVTLYTLGGSSVTLVGPSIPWVETGSQRIYTLVLTTTPSPGIHPLIVSSYVDLSNSPFPTGTPDFSHEVLVVAPEFPEAEVQNEWFLPTVAAQPSGNAGMGRFVNALFVWNNHLYASYGDINANTGPIEVLSLDLANSNSGFVSEATLNTEATGPYRTFGDRLYQVFQDPQDGIGNPEKGMLAWRSVNDSTWHTVPNTLPYAEHVYDIAVTSNGDIFVCGLSEFVDGDGDNHNVVWRSTDDMATWEASYTGPQNPGYPWPYRIYQFGDLLFIWDYPSNSWQGWDGASWSATNPTQGYISNPYDQTADTIKATITSDEEGVSTSGPADIYITNSVGVGLNENAGPAYSVGSFLTNHMKHIQLGQYLTGQPCVSDDGSRIYVMDIDGVVFSYSTTNPKRTQRLELKLPKSLPHEVWGEVVPMCLAVVGNTIYWGGADSRVRSAELPSHN